jgi:uncharacterized DUF497 family protein
MKQHGLIEPALYAPADIRGKAGSPTLNLVLRRPQNTVLLSYIQMCYEWDEDKNPLNQRKHGISFEMAALVFEDERCLVRTDRIDEMGEQRWHAIGAARIEPDAAVVLLVVHVYRRRPMAKKSPASSQPVKLKRVTSDDIKNRKWSEEERQTLRRHAAKQAAGDDSDINFDDIPHLTDEQLAQMVRLRDIRPKVPVSVRLEPRVLAWLKSKGEGHLTRINDILRNIMEAEQRIAHR